MASTNSTTTAHNESEVMQMSDEMEQTIDEPTPTPTPEETPKEPETEEGAPIE
jgi:hypothetical protein